MSFANIRFNLYNQKKKKLFLTYLGKPVNGIQKCSVFGNYECSDFGIKTAVDSATMMQ